MPDYRRWFVPGGTYFFTVVTRNRYQFFRDAGARRLIGNAFREVQSEHPFELFATVLLWDHIHCLWILPPGDCDYPTRWKKIKNKFTTSWLASGGHEEPVTPSQHSRGLRGIWQRRYHEHVIRDVDDLENHFDYIHFNPVKHGYVTHPANWKWSSFHRYLASGHYPAEWGTTEPTHLAGLDFE
jgi:REP-associated tyrosine transposase